MNYFDVTFDQSTEYNTYNYKVHRFPSASTDVIAFTHKQVEELSQMSQELGPIIKIEKVHE